MAVKGKIVRGFGAVAAATACVATGIGPGSAEPGPDGHMYGAFAVSAEQPDQSFVVGSAWNFPDQGAADDTAMSQCQDGTADGSCVIALRFMDGCGALAWRSAHYAPGIGPTRADAEHNAFVAIDPPFPQSISADVMNPARIGGSHCNGEH